MAGRIKQMIDAIVEQRCKGNEALKPLTRSKLVLKGIYPEKYTNMSDDDSVIIEKLEKLASELGVTC